jgi:hypothetical protein
MGLSHEDVDAILRKVIKVFWWPLFYDKFASK